ncbi:MAG: hypothetical protein GF349_02980 [Candidatus Magasanikbacteria bacterium]|nr:hypothetical protein [Candidatus Magasanikbacteria bacterium]
MEQEKTNLGILILAVIITAIVVGTGVYYFLNKSNEPNKPVYENKNEVETTTANTYQTSQKSLIDYYETRVDRETLGENDNFLMKTPDELGFKEIAKIKIECPENPDGPCGGNLLILSQKSLHSGIQEFYFAQAGGAGYTYYGPFFDDLERLVEESKSIESLTEIY